MIDEYKSIQYQGKIVFARAIFSNFRREIKYFSADEACFMFLSKGCFNLRTPEKIIQFKQGDGMLAKCGNYFVERPTNSDGHLDVVAAYFYPSIIRSFFPGDMSLANFKPDFDADRFPVDDMLRIFMNSIIFLMENPAACSDELTLLKMKELLLLLAKSDNAPSIHAFVASLFKPYEYDFRETVLRNSNSNLTLPELALLCNMSLATFKRRFVKVFGESPNKYLTLKKMEKAAELLADSGELRITDIVYECGFETITHFNKVFKKHFGQSPTLYRLSRKEKNLNA